jgi:hypothetical protein
LPLPRNTSEFVRSGASFLCTAGHRLPKFGRRSTILEWHFHHGTSVRHFSNRSVESFGDCLGVICQSPDPTATTRAVTCDTEGNNSKPPDKGIL